jgi:hypothetical protein
MSTPSATFELETRELTLGQAVNEALAEESAAIRPCS